MSTSQEKVSLLKTFQALDLNGDGQLTKNELLEGYKNIMNDPNPVIEVENIMKMVDSNESGAIYYTEFVMATINKQGLLSKQRLEAAFNMFDKVNWEGGRGFEYRQRAIRMEAGISL